MDVPHATLVLQELGRLHAASQLLERRMGCTLTEKWPILEETWLNEKYEMAELFQQMLEANMEASAVIMEQVSMPGETLTFDPHRLVSRTTTLLVKSPLPRNS